MTRVEEKAIDAWAIYEYREHPKGLYHTCFVDGYKEGYHQAEQDLALTWQDIRKICTLSVTVEVQLGREISDEQHYGEILRRFNKTRDSYGNYDNVE